MFQTSHQRSQSQTEKTENFPKDYVRTTDEQKLQLIDLVINQKYSMKLASEIVGVKLSTVKYIIKAYKTDKQYFMGKLKPKKTRIQKEKKKTFSKNQIQSVQESIPKKQELNEAKINQQNDQEKNTQNIYSLTSFYIPNFYPFQGYLHFFPQWNNFPIYNKDSFSNQQEN